VLGLQAKHKFWSYTHISDPKCAVVFMQIALKGN